MESLPELSPRGVSLQLARENQPRRTRADAQENLRKAKIYLLEVAFAAIEGATSDDPRVTALALALVRRGGPTTGGERN
jgi:hypothetical protein